MNEETFVRVEKLVVMAPEEKEAVGRLYCAANGLQGDISSGVAGPTLSQLIQAVKDFQQVNGRARSSSMSCR